MRRGDSSLASDRSELVTRSKLRRQQRARAAAAAASSAPAVAQSSASDGRWPIGHKRSPANTGDRSRIVWLSRPVRVGGFVIVGYDDQIIPSPPAWLLEAA